MHAVSAASVVDFTKVTSNVVKLSFRENYIAGRDDIILGLMSVHSMRTQQTYTSISRLIYILYLLTHCA